jgi:hypothetical protein
MRSCGHVTLLVLVGCGASTGLEAEDAGPGIDATTVDAGPSLEVASCDVTCDGEIDIQIGGGHTERPEGGTLVLTLGLDNCGRGLAPAGVRMVLRGRDETGVLEVLAEESTSLEIPSLMSQALTVDAPWEKWSRYRDREDLCLEVVIDAGDIEDCALQGIDNDNFRRDVEGCCWCIDCGAGEC